MFPLSGFGKPGCEVVNLAWREIPITIVRSLNGVLKHEGTEARRVIPVKMKNCIRKMTSLA